MRYRPHVPLDTSVFTRWSFIEITRIEAPSTPVTAG